MTAISTSARRFHFGLNVADLDRAAAFYETLFGVPPARRADDYAKFEIDDPPLVLALHPGAATTGGALNHVGFRVKDSDALVAVQQRLELAGIRTQREDGVECCYARQTKFWVPDADRNLWEIYTLDEDIEHSGFGGEGAGMPPRPKAAAPVVWRHFLTFPLPDRLPMDDGAADAVELEGTFNADLSAPRRAAFVAELTRILRPGGTVAIRGLVADRAFPGKPALPGPAAMVQRIPIETETHDELLAAGFEHLSFERLGDIHCFRAGGVELREMRLSARKPGDTSEGDDRFVLYRGPMAKLVDDRGRAYPRGERVRVDRSTWDLFHDNPYWEHFTCFACAAESGAVTRAGSEVRGDD